MRGVNILYYIALFFTVLTLIAIFGGTIGALANGSILGAFAIFIGGMIGGAFLFWQTWVLQGCHQITQRENCRDV
jgi:hypothetical protein